jgi:hypothetical protein
MTSIFYLPVIHLISTQLLDNKFGGSNIDFVQSQKTYDNILRYAEKNPTIYLPPTMKIQQTD